MLGNSIGTFEATESDENEKMKGDTLRVKININVEKPLKRGTNVKIGSMAGKTWIPITYEKLPDFCYYYGKLGHVLHECDEEGAETNKRKIYEADLRETKGSKGIYKNWRSEFKEMGNRGRGCGQFGRQMRGNDKTNRSRFEEEGKSSERWRSSNTTKHERRKRRCPGKDEATGGRRGNKRKRKRWKDKRDKSKKQREIGCQNSGQQWTCDRQKRRRNGKSCVNRAVRQKRKRQN